MIVEFTIGGDRQAILVNVRPASFSVSIDTATVYTFDAAGRLLGSYKGGHNYLRGQDNRILEKWGAGHGLANRSRRDLDEQEKATFLGEMKTVIGEIEQAVRLGRIRLKTARTSPTDLDQVARALGSVQGYDELHAHGRRFHDIYKPISILPPDQYLALVLQATEGCSWNKCTFCNFYRDRPFRIKRAEEFRRHIRAVLDFIGPALGLRRSVFLADANALSIPQRTLLELLDVLSEELPIMPAGQQGGQQGNVEKDTAHALQGIYSFVDAFTGRRKSSADYSDLAARHLRRVYIGLESGDDELLRFLCKGSTAEDARRTVETIKAGGVDVGVILMLGVGGRQFSEAHVRRSIEVINAMNLGGHDILYFSPFFDFAGSEYSQRAQEWGVEPLSGAEMDAQIAAIRRGLRFSSPTGRPKIAVYDIREFIY